MADTHLVLVDTCMWVPFFNRPQSAERKSIDSLLDDDRAAITGEVLYEILVGFRRSDQADWVASALRGVQLLVPTRNEWRLAATQARRLIAGGHHLPLTDVILATVAITRGLAIYTTDPHFDRFVDLHRFQPR